MTFSCWCNILGMDLWQPSFLRQAGGALIILSTLRPDNAISRVRRWQLSVLRIFIVSPAGQVIVLSCTLGPRAIWASDKAFLSEFMYFFKRLQSVGRFVAQLKTKPLYIIIARFETNLPTKQLYRSSSRRRSSNNNNNRRNHHHHHHL